MSRAASGLPTSPASSRASPPASSSVRGWPRRRPSSPAATSAAAAAPAGSRSIRRRRSRRSPTPSTDRRTADSDTMIGSGGLRPSLEQVSNVSRESPPPRRLKIAVLLDHLNFFGRGYEGQLRDALYKRGAASGHNLVLVYGGAIDEPTLAAADNVIFRIIRSDDFDGIIVA